MVDRNSIIDQFFGDRTTPIEWESEEEKKLHFWLDDLHCPDVLPIRFHLKTGPAAGNRGPDPPKRLAKA